MTGSWIPYPPTGVAGAVRLLCFPCAGQGASAYRSWQALLGPRIEVVPVQLPGRECRAAEPAHSDMQSLMAELWPALDPWLEPPFALFGHSLGADVAFELARRAQAAGRPAEHLAVAAQLPPHRCDRTDPGRMLLHRLPHGAFMTMLGLYGQMPIELFDDPAALQRAATTLRADFAVVETYSPLPEPALDCPITVLGGLSDPSAPPRRLRAWQELTDAPVAVRLVPGGHFFVGTRRTEVTSMIRSDLERIAVDRT